MSSRSDEFLDPFCWIAGSLERDRRFWTDVWRARVALLPLATDARMFFAVPTRRTDEIARRTNEPFRLHTAEKQLFHCWIANTDLHAAQECTTARP